MVAMVPGLTAVMAVKRLDRAKSRLSHTGAGGRQSLVLAMFHDTLAAVVAAGVARIVVVSPDPLIRARAAERGATTRVDPVLPGGPDLNAALTHGAAGAQGDVVYLQADLPSLRAETVSAAVETAQAHPVSFVADRHRTGTALLYVARGTPFTPRFGPDSADAHRRAGAVELDPGRTGWADLRCDVDTPDDLAACVTLGVGEATARAIARDSEQ